MTVIICSDCGERRILCAKGRCRKCYDRMMEKDRPYRYRYRPLRHDTDVGIKQLYKIGGVRVHKVDQRPFKNYEHPQMKIARKVMGLMKYVPMEYWMEILDAPNKPGWDMSYRRCYHVPKYARGMCKSCYGRFIYHNNPEFRERVRKHMAEYHKAHPAARKAIPGGLHERRKAYRFICKGEMRKLEPEITSIIRSRMMAKMRKGGFGALKEGNSSRS